MDCEVCGSLIGIRKRKDVLAFVVVVQFVDNVGTYESKQHIIVQCCVLGVLIGFALVIQLVFDFADSLITDIFFILLLVADFNLVIFI